MMITHDSASTTQMRRCWRTSWSIVTNMTLSSCRRCSQKKAPITHRYRISTSAGVSQYTPRRRCRAWSWNDVGLWDLRGLDIAFGPYRAGILERVAAGCAGAAAGPAGQPPLCIQLGVNFSYYEMPYRNMKFSVGRVTLPV